MASTRSDANSVSFLPRDLCILSIGVTENRYRFQIVIAPVLGGFLVVRVVFRIREQAASFIRAHPISGGRSVVQYLPQASRYCTIRTPIMSLLLMRHDPERSLWLAYLAAMRDVSNLRHMFYLSVDCFNSTHLHP